MIPYLSLTDTNENNADVDVQVADGPREPRIHLNARAPALQVPAYEICTTHRHRQPPFPSFTVLPSCVQRGVSAIKHYYNTLNARNSALVTRHL